MYRMLLFIIASLFGCSLMAKEKETIEWHYANFPPANISEGPLKGTGYMDKAIELIRQKMKNYEHKFVLSSYSRFLSLMEEGTPICSLALLKSPDREKYVSYSKPVVVLLTNRIIYLKKQEEKFRKFIDKNGEIDFQNLLKNSNLKLGIASGRKYSPLIDQVLKEGDGKAKVFVRAGSDMFEGLFKMLMSERVDYIIGYSNEAYFVSKAMNAMDKYEIVKFKDGSQSLTGQMGCTKSSWGKKVIESLNNDILDNGFIDTIAEEYSHWLTKDELVDYKASYKKYLKQ